MLYPTDRLKIVAASEQPHGTFINAIGTRGQTPVLGVVVHYAEPQRVGIFFLEGPSAYRLTSANTTRGFTVSGIDKLSIQLPENEILTMDRYNDGQLSLTENGAFIIGMHGPEWQPSRIYVNVNTWAVELGLGEFTEPECFDNWSLVATDAHGNRDTFFTGQRVTPPQ